MKTFLDSAMPSLFGAGVVLVTLHILRAIWGHPKAMISAAKFGVSPLEFSKMYYRSLRSWMPTGLMILGFVIGAGLAGYSRIPLDRLGLPWCSPLIAGLTVAIAIWLALRCDAREIRDFVIARAEQDQNQSEQAARGDRP